MITSLRGLVVLAVIAAVLAIVVIVDATRRTAPVDHRLVHVDVAKIQTLAWRDLTATRVGMQWKAGDAILDGGAIDDVLHTLEAATWHRHGGAAGRAHGMLRVDAMTIGIADDLPGTAQTWILVDGVPYLVDSWVAHALSPSPLALHVLHPLAAARSSNRLWVGSLQLAGHPRVLADHRLADVAAVAALERALADAEVVALAESADSSTTVDPNAPSMQIALDDGSATLGGACSGHTELVAVWGPYGHECVPAAAVVRITEAARLANAVERRPVWFEPTSATLGDGTTIDLRSVRATALVRALTAAATELLPPAAPAESPQSTSAEGSQPAPGATSELAHLAVSGARGEHIDLRVRPHDRVERTTDGAVLQIAHADWLVLQQPAAAYADPARWSEDPTAVESIGVAGITYRRGAVLGEWTPGKPLGAAALEDLASALARVEARVAAPAPTAHIITVTLAPPVGAQVTHTLELGAKCAGRIDGAPVAFEPATCAGIERAMH